MPAAPFDVRNKTPEGVRDGVREQAVARARTAGSVARKIAERDRAKAPKVEEEPKVEEKAKEPSADRKALAKSMIGEKKPRIPGLGKKE